MTMIKAMTTLSVTVLMVMIMQSESFSKPLTLRGKCVTVVPPTGPTNLCSTACLNGVQFSQTYSQSRRDRKVLLLNAGNRITMDTSDSDFEEEDVTYLNEEQLRLFWAKSGMSASSYNQDAALTKMLLSDEDDEDDFIEAILPEKIKFSRSKILGRSKGKISPSIVSNVSEDIAVIQTGSSTKTKKKMLLNKSPKKSSPVKEDSSVSPGTTTKKKSEEVALDSNGLPIPAGRSVGIDLGTTNSAISIIEGGKPVIIPCGGNRIVPSVVGYDKNGKVIIGEKARRQYVINPKNTFSSVKRIIGRTIKEITQNGEKLSTHKIDKKYIKKGGTTEDINMNCPNLIRNISPIEVSSEILKNLVSEASAYLGGEIITKAVITVPAYFSPAQCDATIKAGEAAGLLRIKLLREPEAAALAYGLTQRDRQIVLVFDLGGGTFDVSVLEVGDGFVEVIATSGDSHLGGDDFDALIVDWFIEQYSLIHDKEIAKTFIGNPAISSRLYEAAEKAKFALSTDVNTTISIPFLYEDTSLTCVLTRRKFEQISKKLLTRLLKPLREVAIMAGINLPGESGQLGVNEDLFFSGEEIENSGVVDLRRNDGMSNRKNSNSDDNYREDVNDEKNSGNSMKRKNRKNENDDNDSDSDSDDEVENILRSQRDISDAAYRAGTTISQSSPPLMSIADLKKQQLGGRNNAKEMKKVKGSTTKELRRLQKEMKDSSLAAFPGGQALDDVILVGGSTRIPAVQRLVKIITGVDPRRTVNPDEAVSLGAAVMAGILDGDISDMQVLSAWQAAMYRAFYEDYRKTDKN